MVTIKKPEEIKVLRIGGGILAEVLSNLVKKAKPGVKTIELDKLAEELVIKKGGIPSFKNYKSYHDEEPFPSSICASVNEQLVHTPASDYELKKGDILSIDIGMKYPAEDPGYFTDMAVTVPIGRATRLGRQLIKVTRQSLKKGISQVKPGNHVADISRAIQEYVEDQGFSVNRQLVGHGVGYQVHEEPRIPNFISPKQKDVELKPGMVLAIEPMVNAGKPEVETLTDGWTVVTADKELCAHFEHTVVVTKDGCEILTE